MQDRDEFGRADRGRVEPVTPPMGIRLPAGGPGAQQQAAPSAAAHPEDLRHGAQQYGAGWDASGQASDRGAARAEPVTPPMGTPLPLGGAGNGAALGGPVLDDAGASGLIDDVGHAAPAVIGGADPFDDGRVERDWPTLARNRNEPPEEQVPDGAGGSWVGRMFGNRRED
ncbi:MULTISPECIES: hypothetical protein [Actinoalloteichus]|uniref:Uncharacterized protein n=1 Tax=Actinoalloteichus fjordicus TaxID=1612552 RepID=A0AAC9LAI1_9PSEU|nr:MULTISPECIES: hypothetical protein [Actinoalloteichus]APU14011.1 hypothetical protein UA74_09740 [Actinoalloteichus fjordicus]APU19957.1 hypothetical protein UA75_09710 [Actinoalloteichus sp. GBA129-24]